jgi:hypothetical protein
MSGHAWNGVSMLFETFETFETDSEKLFESFGTDFLWMLYVAVVQLTSQMMAVVLREPTLPRKALAFKHAMHISIGWLNSTCNSNTYLISFNILRDQ